MYANCQSIGCKASFKPVRPPPIRPPPSHNQNGRFMDGLGYYISSRGFKGPFIPAADIRGGRPVHLLGINLYCVKKALRDAIAAAGGGRGGRRRRL